MRSYKYIILGGGMVAGYAAKEFIEKKGGKGELCIISADDTLPYERPPLSKSYLAGEIEAEEILISPKEFYEQHGIEVLLNTVVEAVDIHNRVLVLQSEEQVEYMNLLIATGAQPRRFDVPGALLDGIYYLRSFDDSHMIRTRSSTATTAVVIGSGFIGMEVTASLTKRGVKTTMVFPEERVWSRFFTPQMSAFFEKYYTERGVRLLPKSTVTGFEGDAHVTEVMLESGERLPADMVVAGIGVTPVTDIIEDTDILLDNGIVVNECLQTNVEQVYAAGDVARYYDVLFDKKRRVEHWDNAVEQGKAVMRIMMGEEKSFVHVPYFFSDVFDLSYEFWGDAEGADAIIHRGDTNSRSFSVWWLREQELIAAFIMNRPDEERDNAAPWIENLQKLSAKVLEDETKSVTEAVL